MRVLFLSLILFISQVLVAGETDPAGNEKRLEEKKTEALQMVDERIEGLNKLRSCISASSTAEALKSCRKEHRESMKEMRLEMRGKKREHLEKRRDHLDEKIKKLDEQKKQEE